MLSAVVEHREKTYEPNKISPMYFASFNTGLDEMCGNLVIHAIMQRCYSSNFRVSQLPCPICCYMSVLLKGFCHCEAMCGS